MLYEGEAVPAIEAAFRARPLMARLIARVFGAIVADRRDQAVGADRHPMAGRLPSKILHEADNPVTCRDSGCAVAVRDRGENTRRCGGGGPTTPEIQRQRVLAATT